jgi:hypothetical protein
MLERDIVKKIRQHLLLKYNTPCFKTHGGPMSEAGVSDLNCSFAPSGRMLCLEVKQPGKHPTELQKAWLEKYKKAGAIAGVVTSVEDVEKLLDSSSST